MLLSLLRLLLLVVCFVNIVICESLGGSSNLAQVTLIEVARNDPQFNTGYLWAAHPLMQCFAYAQGNQNRVLPNWIHGKPGSLESFPPSFTGIAGGALLQNRLINPLEPWVGLKGGWFILGGFVGTGWAGRLMNSNQIYVSTDLMDNWFVDHDFNRGITTIPTNDNRILSMSPQAPLNGFVAVVFNENFVYCGGHTGTNILTPLLNQGMISSSCFSSQTGRAYSWEPLLKNDILARYDAAATLVALIPGVGPPGEVLTANDRAAIRGFMVITGGSTNAQFVTNDVLRIEFLAAPVFSSPAPALDGDARTEAVLKQLGQAPWTPRSGHQAVNFRNFTVISGGYTTAFEALPTKNFQPYNPSYSTNMFQASHYNPIAMNDVWYSQDAGVTWRMSSAQAPWPPRFYHNMVATSAGLYVLAGTGTLGFNGNIRAFNDLWQSIDFGSSWSPIPVTYYPPKFLAMVANIGSIATGGSAFALVGGIDIQRKGALSREVHYIGVQGTRLDNGIPLLIQPPALALAIGPNQTATLIPIFGIVLVVVGTALLIIFLLALVICRGAGTAKEKTIKFGRRFITYKPKKNGAKVSAPVNVTSTIDGNANYTATGGTRLDKAYTGEANGTLRSDDPDAELHGEPGQPLTSGLNEGNAAMIGNFHYTSKIDSSATYGSPRNSSTPTTYGQTAGSAHPAYQFQTPQIQTGYGQTNYSPALQPNTNNYNTTGYGYGQNNTTTGYGYGQQQQASTGYGQTNYRPNTSNNNYY